MGIHASSTRAAAIPIRAPAGEAAGGAMGGAGGGFDEVG